MQEILPVGQAAQYKGVGPDTIRRWIKDGHLPVYADTFDRRRRLVLREDLDKVGEPRIGERIIVEGRVHAQL